MKSNWILVARKSVSMLESTQRSKNQSWDIATRYFRLMLEHSPYSTNTTLTEVYHMLSSEGVEVWRHKNTLHVYKANGSTGFKVRLS